MCGPESSSFLRSTGCALRACARFHFLNDMQELLRVALPLRVPRKLKMPQLAMVAAPHLLLLLISSTHAAAVYAPLAAPEAPKEGAPQPTGAPWLRLLLQTVLR